MKDRVARALLTVACVASALLGGTTTASAASTPQGAVEALVERIGSGGFEDLSGVACPEFADAVRAEFDPTASDPSLGSVDVEIVDPAITLVSEEEGTAIVNLAATMRVTFDEEQLREYVRAQLEAGGQEATEDAIDQAMQGVVGSGDIPVDEDLSVIERDGEWLICEAGGGFVDEGMCGLVSPDEIAALAPVPIQSNVGEGDYCQWIGATDTDYFSVDVGLVRDASLDDYRADDPDALELTAAGQPAIASFGQLLVEVEEGVLSVVPYLEDSPGAEGIDPVQFASSIAELFVPNLGALPAAVDDGGVGPVDGGAAILADCGAIPLDDLEAVGPLSYDVVTGSGGYCVYSSTDPEAGSHFVSISVDTTSTVEDLMILFGGGTEREVAGRRAYAALDTLWVELDGATLSIGPVFADSPAAEGLDPYDYAGAIAELVIGILEPEA